MIDDLRRVNRLLVKLEENLPVLASLTPQLAATLREETAGADVPQQCRVTAVHYLGEEGGIICRLDHATKAGWREFVASITHLTFDRNQPCAGEIAAYQKHRSKRQNKLQSGN